ncbi:MAG: hypothetical protein KJ726_09515, partial [Verrucomicrobia bacterium]|nr:hypothetical protein [Verrucomicrobiota bacterium]
MNRIITRIAPAPISRTCFFIALGLLLHAAPLAAEEGPFLDKPKASFEAKLGLIQKKYLEELPAGISNKYSKLLSDYAEASRAQGKLRDYLAAQKELERFQAAGKVEEQDVSADSEYVGKAQRSVIAAYESNLRNMRIEEAKLRQSYIQFLEKSKKALTRQNQIDQAILVDAEIEQVKASLDPSALAPATPARGAGENEPRAPASPASLVQKPIGEDRLVVFATDAKGPVSGLDITLKSQTFDKSFRKQTDRAGRAEFTILPELEYFIYILNSKYEPFIRPHCIGGESYVAEMQAMPEGVNVIEMPITGDFKLPGISNIRISGHYGLSGQKISGISLQPSSFRTSFSGNPPQQESIKLDLDTWMIVAERSRQVEIKALAPDDGIRLIL